MTDPTTTWLHRFADRLISARWVALILAILLTIVAFPLATKLRFDQSIESLYAEDDPHFRDYSTSKSLFGGDEFAIVAFEELDLFMPNGVDLTNEAAERITKLANELSKAGVKASSTKQLAHELSFPYKRKEVLDFVESILVGSDGKTTAIVLRLLNVDETRTLPLSVNERVRLADLLKETKDIDERSRAILAGLAESDGVQDESLQASLASLNSRIAVLDSPTRLRLEAFLRAIPRPEAIARIRAIADRQQPPAFVVGEPVQVHDMFRYVEEDGFFLFSVSLVLLAGVIFIFFRSLRWVILPLGVVVVTICWTEALLVATQMKLSMVSSMLRSLVTIIGVATVTHVTIHYRELRREKNRVESLRQTIVELAPAIFWTSATTAVGFAALLTSNITPIRSFGIMIALGTLLVMVACMALLPGGILLGRLELNPGEAPAEKRLVGLLSRITGWVDGHPLLLSTIAIGFVVFALLGFFRLDVETDFSKNFRKSSRIVQSLSFVETRLGGAGTWEVNFPAPHKLDDQFIDRLNELATTLRDELGRKESGGNDEGRLTKVICLADGLEFVPKKIGFLKLSLSKRLSLVRAAQPEFESGLSGRVSSKLTGTVRIGVETNSVTGLETRFKAELKVGDSISIAGTTLSVVSIADDTSLTVEDNWEISNLGGDAAFNGSIRFKVVEFRGKHDEFPAALAEVRRLEIFESEGVVVDEVQDTITVRPRGKPINIPSWIREFERLGLVVALPEFSGLGVTKVEPRMRIVLRARERQTSASKLALIQNVQAVTDRKIREWREEDARGNSGSTLPPGNAKTTGLFVLLTFLIESLLRDQMISFAVAAVGIAGMMTLAFRSLRLGLISLIPNLFPIVMVIGTMGWIGLPINIATAMIASVSMGLTVDSSIHYITAYRRARGTGLSVYESMLHTHTRVGRALVFANVALIVGFSVLTLSHFIPLIYFGILVSVAMFGGLIGNLVLLPLLLQWVDRDNVEPDASAA